jgi:glutathione S-transferase
MAAIISPTGSQIRSADTIHEQGFAIMTTTLYFAPGSCARVPLIALEEIGEPFDTQLIAFMKGQHRSAEYLAVNPAGKVPALAIDNGVITQNTAILHYLARRFPDAKLLPVASNMVEEAQWIARISWFSADLHPLVTRIRMPHFLCDLPEAPVRVREMASSSMAMQLAPVEQALSNAPWFLGEQWSVLDAYLYWVWYRITGAGFDASGFPAIAAHAARMEQRPSVQRALAREESAEAELAARGLAVPLG